MKVAFSLVPWAGVCPKTLPGYNLLTRQIVPAENKLVHGDVLRLALWPGLIFDTWIGASMLAGVGFAVAFDSRDNWFVIMVSNASSPCFKMLEGLPPGYSTKKCHALVGYVFF